MSEAAGVIPGVTSWRKRPVVIEGIPWDGGNREAVEAFAAASGAGRFQWRGSTLLVWNDQEETWLPVPVGHVLMRGVLGELYPVSPAALAKTFDPAEGCDEPGGESDGYEPFVASSGERIVEEFAVRPASEVSAAIDALAKVAGAHARVMYAALIDIRRGDPGGAKRLLAEQLDGWEGPPWNGTDTGAEWLERTREVRQ